MDRFPFSPLRQFHATTPDGSAKLEVSIGLSNYNRSAFKNSLLWLLGEAIVGVFFYALLNHLPDFAQVIILLLAIVVIWYRVELPEESYKNLRNTALLAPHRSWSLLRCHVENNWRGCLGETGHRMYMRESCL